MDIVDFAHRYTGKPVSVKTHGNLQYIGVVRSVTDQVLVLTNCVHINEHDASQWQEHTVMADVEDGIETGAAEVVIQFHSIISIVCDHELEALEEASNLVGQQIPTGIQTGVVHRFVIRFATALAPFVSDRRSDLTKRIEHLRNDLFEEIGFHFPSVRLLDSRSLDDHEYQVEIDGAIVATGQLYPHKKMALSPNKSACELDGIATVEPAFGLEACWIEGEENVLRAEEAGYTVVEGVTVLITHMSELIKNYRQDLLSYEHVAKLLDGLRGSAGNLVGDTFQTAASRWLLFEVLQKLLEERVWIGCFEKIAEAVGGSQAGENDVMAVVERIRPAIGRQILRRCVNRSREVNAVLLDNDLCGRIGDQAFLYDAGVLGKLIDVCRDFIAEAATDGNCVAFVVPQTIRTQLHSALRRSIPESIVVALEEIPQDYVIPDYRTIGLLDLLPPESFSDDAPPAPANQG